MGRIRIDEPIEAAAIREAYEETGLSIEVLAVPLLYMVNITFKDWTLLRWHFIITGKAKGHVLQPVDIEEIGRASFFSEQPSNSDPFLNEWLREIIVRA